MTSSCIKKTLLMITVATPLVIQTGFAAKRNTPASCLSAAIAAAESWRKMATDDDVFTDQTFSTDGFIKTSVDSSVKRGLVYAKFGRDNGDPKNYIVVAYFGKQCWSLSDSKLFCNLEEDDTGWANVTDATTRPLTNDTRMACHLCFDVHLTAAGSEANATDPTPFSNNELVSRTSALTSAIVNANTPSGTVFTLDSTPRNWNSHSPTADCQTITFN